MHEAFTAVGFVSDQNAAVAGFVLVPDDRPPFDDPASAGAMGGVLADVPPRQRPAVAAPLTPTRGVTCLTPPGISLRLPE